MCIPALWLETDFTYGLLDRTHKGSNPREICAALPESGAGFSRGIYALKRADLMFLCESPSFKYGCCAVFYFSVKFKVAVPGHGWHLVLNVRVWLPGEPGRRTVSTYLGGRCWSQPQSWPWRSPRSVWGPAGPLGCSPCAAAPVSDSPAPPWRPWRERERGIMRWCQTLQTELSEKHFIQCHNRLLKLVLRGLEA